MSSSYTKWWVLLLAAGGMLGLTGCEAAGPMFTPAVTQADEAVIYVYRHGEYTGSAVTLKIDVDDERAGELKPNGYLYKIVPPGPHMVSCKTESKSAVAVDAEPGQSYYIEADVVMGFWVGRPKLSMVMPQIGRANIGGKKLSVGKPPSQTKKTRAYPKPSSVVVPAGATSNTASNLRRGP